MGAGTRDGGRDNDTSSKLKEHKHGLNKTNGADRKLADCNFGRSGTEKVSWDHDEQRGHHDEDGATMGMGIMEDAKTHYADRKGAQQGQHRAQHSDSFTNQINRGHCSAQDDRSAELSPVGLHRGGEASSEQDHAEKARPPRIGGSTMFKLFELVSCGISAELTVDDVVGEDAKF